MSKACPDVIAHRVSRFVYTNNPCHPMQVCMYISVKCICHFQSLYIGACASLSPLCARAGYDGLRCESHTCQPGLCGNGTCVKTVVPPFYNCSCNEGYTGENCMDMVNPCQGVDCKHGMCESVGNSYNCTCEPGACACVRLCVCACACSRMCACACVSW